MPAYPLTLGIDLGGTKVRSALVDARGRVLQTYRHPTGAGREEEAVVDDIVAAVEVCLNNADDRAEAIGVGVAGQVDTAAGIVRDAPNLGWEDFPLRDALESAFDRPVVVANDVRAITWGIWIHGAGRGVDDLVVVFVGTGVGGGVVSGGRMLEGATGTAAEVGHMTLVAGGRKCTCPNVGCLEAYVGGWAIAERAREAARAEPDAARTLVELAGSLENITGKIVDRAFEQADALALRLVEETGRYLGAGLVGLVNAFNPKRLVLGGGVIDGVPELVDHARSVVEAHALEVPRAAVDIVHSELGDTAGVIGAAVLARTIVE